MNSTLIRSCGLCKNSIRVGQNDYKCKLYVTTPTFIPKNEIVKKEYTDVEIARFEDFDLCGNNAKYFEPVK